MNVEDRDVLLGALVGLARATDGNEELLTEETAHLFFTGLTLPDKGCRKDTVAALLSSVDTERKRIIPGCYACVSPCGRNEIFDMKKFYDFPLDVQREKLLILYAAEGAAAVSPEKQGTLEFCICALRLLGMEDMTADDVCSIGRELMTRYLDTVETESENSLPES